MVDEAPTLTLLPPKPKRGTDEMSRSPALIGSTFVYDAFNTTEERSVDEPIVKSYCSVRPSPSSFSPR